MSPWEAITIIHNIDPESSLEDVGGTKRKVPKFFELLETTNGAIARGEIGAIQTEESRDFPYWVIGQPERKPKSIDVIGCYDLDSDRGISDGETSLTCLDSGESWTDRPFRLDKGDYEISARAVHYHPFTFTVHLYEKVRLDLTIYLRNASCADNSGQGGLFETDTEWPYYTVDLRDICSFFISKGLVQRLPHRLEEAFGYVELQAAPSVAEPALSSSADVETQEPKPDHPEPRYATPVDMEWARVRITVVGETGFTASAGRDKRRDFSYEDLAMNRKNKRPNIQWEVLLEMAKRGAYNIPDVPNHRDNTGGTQRSAH